ncbi:hypothetical protein AMK16_01470 [Streptomyces sp. CB00455]|uniref:hypothetical protein n=1 Tax=Streptomyces sp. CB00455 TaxID=1703927 RepID=UPI00093B71D5|nr:hypothetical protein [Streptomyces sp. CB00455]OKK21943.1 hypothetical protein AMK16_01470 [Streptomyces sp. CB00455]
MRTTRTVTAALVLAAVLAGCSSGGSTDPGPAVPPSAPPTTSPAPKADGQKETCVRAIAGQAATDPGRLQAQPRPAGCEGLEDAAYLEAYYDALKQVKEKGRDALSGGSTGG